MSTCLLSTQRSDPVVPGDAGIDNNVFDSLSPDILPDNLTGDDEIDHSL
jgi:hypothetical protein